MEIKKFLGLRNVSAPDREKPGALDTALDVDIDNSGALRSRTGQTLVTATASHSMWAKPGLCLVAQGTSLRRMDEAGALTTLGALSTVAPISYVEDNGVVYFSNGTDTGRIVAGALREWGVRAPSGQPQVVGTAGGLPAGRYLYAMTFLRDDGMESGSHNPGIIELTDIGGISFLSMPASTDSSVVGKALYISAPNGTELYRIAVVGASVTSHSYTNAGTDLGVLLQGQYAGPPPPGTIVEIHAGVAYVVTGSTAYASDQYQYERFRLSSRFLQLPGAITMFAAVSGGIYAATDTGTWFFAGTDPDAMKVSKVLEVGAIPGTAARVDSGEETDDDKAAPSRPGLLWASTDGIISGDADGVVKDLTVAQYGVPSAERGAAIVRAQRGYTSYLLSLRGTATGNQYS